MTAGTTINTAKTTRLVICSFLKIATLSMRVKIGEAATIGTIWTTWP